MSNSSRNAALIGPKGTGKTTLAEAALFVSGTIKKMGAVEAGGTISDFDPQEIERKMSLFPTACSMQWNGDLVHFVDTPGYPDLVGESKAVARMMDNAVMPVSGVDGVKSHAVKIWNMLRENSIPTFVFLNEMDKEGASLETAWESLKSIFRAVFVPVTLPLFKDGKLIGVIDMLKGKALIAPAGVAGKYAEQDIPEDSSAEYESFRESLIEAAAEMQDSLMEKYLEGEEVSAEEIATAVRAGVVTGKLCPVLCGSAATAVGVAQLLDAFKTLSASAEERGGVKGKDSDGNETERQPHENEQLSAQVFKTSIDQYAGKITLLRVFSGVLKPDTILLNTRENRKERIGVINLVHGKNFAPAQTAGPGDIVAVFKLQETVTGDTLSSSEAQITYPAMVFPQPVLSIAIRPKERGDEDKLSTGLNRICEEDPQLKLSRHEQTKELTISGTGQFHVDSVVERLKRRFSVDVEVSMPQVPYLETIRKKVTVQGRHKKQTGGHGQFGDVWLEFEPVARGEGFSFENKIFGGAVPRNYIPAVEKGVAERLSRGVMSGHPVIDVRVTITDGSFHAVDSSDMAFKIAASLAVNKGIREADPVILEPIMGVEVEAPGENMGDIIGDINGRRGRVTTIGDAPGGVKLINALVPQAEMLRYAPDLNSMTSGRGTYTMELSHYDFVPKKVSDEIIEKYEKSRKEEE